LGFGEPTRDGRVCEDYSSLYYENGGKVAFVTLLGKIVGIIFTKATLPHPKSLFLNYFLEICHECRFLSVLIVER
jgi:hypothetical protein